MNTQGQAVGETANGRDVSLASANNGAYPKRARLFSPDGHASKDVITTVADEYVERFVRNHARCIVWRISVRKTKEGGARWARWS